jgi:Flp pilus assembly pilin Flp
MMVALIGAVLMGIWGALSGTIGASFTKVSTTLDNAGN